MDATTTITAASFLNGIGVDTHIPYTDGGYANLSSVQADLDYLGVTQLRDGISNGDYGSAPLASYIQLAKAGEKFTFVVGGGASTSASIQSTLDLIEQLEVAVPGSVRAVEGPNEINNQTLTFNGVGGLQGAVALQQYLYQTVKSTPALAGVAVDYFTGYNTVGFAAGPDPSTTTGLADYDTQHPYPQSGQAPAHWVDPATALGNEPDTKGSFVYTETGYTTNLSSSDGVDATVQGKYILDLLMDAAKDGSSGTYLYQLMDAYKPGSPQGDDGYGLLDENNNPKLAATGIHNLSAVLADKGATASTFTPAALAYAISGQPSNGNSLEISKSDGTTDIAVWAEPQLWNANTKSEVAASTETETLSLDGAHQVSVYDPLLGTSPIATYASTSVIQLQITDHPLIVEIDPTVASTEGTLQISSQPPVTIAPSGTNDASTTIAATTTISAGVTAEAVPSLVDQAGASAVPVTTAPNTPTSVNATTAPIAPSNDQSSADTSEVASSATSSTSSLATAPLANTTVTSVPAMASITVHRDGSSTVDVQGANQTLSSDWHDLFLNHGEPESTFVFDPGYGRDIVRAFRSTGSDHDTLSFAGADFDDSIASVLRNTTMINGSAVITDPMSGDTVRLTGVTKGQLVHNQQDLTFHA